MENEFIPYEQALALKSLGFDEACFGYYDGNHNLQFMYNGIPEKFTERRMGPADSVLVGWVSAPLYQQAFRWFRDKHNQHSILIPYCDSSGEVISYRFEIVVQDYNLDDFESERSNYTYKEAELGCLKKLIEIVKVVGSTN
tara:strand:+ start:51 stop:473 length:423 start_codon:yes stop_codon:yes gene_type:complete